ncbi:hypothetical protein Q5530_00135 [Saccharothrix sp. BKS2]|uniref:hypothetical protein n=1 Tax=Saccharothrix sp. BKS2 TaxID=3064400 RepID=UPI0039E9D6D2
MTTTQDTTAPPATLVAAFFGFLVSAVSALAGGLVVLGMEAELADAVRRSNPGFTEDQVGSAVTLGQATVLGTAVLIALVYLWLSFKLKAGRNWARVTLTVFTALQVAAVVTGDGNTWVGYASAAVAVLALVLSYLPSSSAHFRRAR